MTAVSRSLLPPPPITTMTSRANSPVPGEQEEGQLSPTALALLIQDPTDSDRASFASVLARLENRTVQECVVDPQVRYCLLV